MTRRGFTLVEMLVATLLAAILLGGVLAVASSAARDAVRASAVPVRRTTTLQHLLESDFTNAQLMQFDENGQSLTLTGNNALDPISLRPNHRFARIVYAIDPMTHSLARQQRYLDDDIHPQPWIELVSHNVARIDVSSANSGAPKDDDAKQSIPRSVVVSIESASSNFSMELRPR